MKTARTKRLLTGNTKAKSKLRCSQIKLKDMFKKLADTKAQSCHVKVTCGRSMLLIINVNRSSVIVDSHQHKVTHTIIAFASAGQADSLALWFTRMHYECWD